MIYPKNIEIKLGFDKIRQLLKDNCISTLGQAYVDKIQFSNNFDLISKLTLQTSEFGDILRQGEGFPKNNYIDVSEHLKKATLYGAFLSDFEFFDLKLSLHTIADCLKFFDKSAPEAYPNLKELRNQVEFDKKLIGRIELVIDDRGKIRDDASYELRSIRAKIIEEQSLLRKRLDSILRSAKQQGFAKEDALLTLREGRMVIPIAAEFKRKIRGFVHDESATGQTVFLEPAEIIDINNEIRELHYEERREIIRILTQLTNEVRPHVQNLEKAYQFLGMMDFIRAKAIFAQKIGGIRPSFFKKNLIEWRKAVHPLLFLSLEEHGKKIVPLNINLSPKQRILIISGPNAGGKSVALKTVGLLQYMFQCGLLVPMNEDSSMGLFKDIFIDIGDEQSIENDLSTYSSHLTNMKHFLEFADRHSLFLIDEFGTGTEPTMGGAISEAILEKLNASKAFGVITTHYSNLKTYAENHEGVVNGAMQFDSKNLRPLYQLEIGLPGSSFAFEIAKKIGLPEGIIHKARNHVGLEHVNYDQLLQELEIEKKNYATQSQVVQAKEEKLKEVTDEYAKLRDYLDREKTRIINQAKAEAQKILQKANQKIENTIRIIKENKAEKEITKQIREELEEFKEEIKPTEIVFEDPAPVEVEEEVLVIEGEIQVGDKVRLKGQTALGEVVAIKGKDVEILIGDLKSNVKKTRLEKVSHKTYKEEQKKIKRSFKGIDMLEKMNNFSSELDLRGKRAEEALYELEVFLDDALLLGIHEVRIIHGKGDGILRKLVREKLQQYKEITGIRDEHADRGGAGITLASMK
ncbi:MAG: endonuclease MutS2 [Microscillaceae bacterium]|nr:endonuclease MutS2 [Microscillaceae bacterium]